jgi:hypothetical protein
LSRKLNHYKAEIRGEIEMKRLVRGVFGAGVVGVLAGVERLLQNSVPARAPEVKQPATVEDVPATEEPVAAESLKTERHFSIKRTKSEVGYVYWILEGYGKYKCFVLCDSWDEAVAQAKAKLAAGGEAAEMSPERASSAVA